MSEESMGGAQQQFMMNTLRGGGSGGNIGSNAALEMNGAFNGSAFGYSGFESMQKKFQPALGVTVAKFFEAIQGTAQAASPTNFGMFKNPVPGLMSTNKKVPSLFSSRGG